MSLVRMPVLIPPQNVHSCARQGHADEEVEADLRPKE